MSEKNYDVDRGKELYIRLSEQDAWEMWAIGKTPKFAILLYLTLQAEPGCGQVSIPIGTIKKFFTHNDKSISSDVLYRNIEFLSKCGYFYPDAEQEPGVISGKLSRPMVERTR